MTIKYHVPGIVRAFRMTGIHVLETSFVLVLPLFTDT